MRRWHTLLFGMLALVFWLVPFFVSGWTGKTWSWLPRTVSFQHTAAGLFTKRTEFWWDHHIEGERMDGTRFEMPEHLLFPTGAFGFRSKYDRIMNESVRSRMVKRIRLRLAEHIFYRWESLGNDVSDLKAVRLFRSVWSAGTKDMAEPKGAWSTPQITVISPEQKVLLGGYHCAAGRVRPFWQEGDTIPQIRPQQLPPQALTTPPPVRKLSSSIK